MGYGVFCELGMFWAAPYEHEYHCWVVIWKKEDLMKSPTEISNLVSTLLGRVVVIHLRI